MILRGKDVFEMHCQSPGKPTIEVFIWFEKTFTLKYFHVCNSDLFDIMHDLFEGVAQYEIKKLFEYLMQHLTSEQDLLSRI